MVSQKVEGGKEEKEEEKEAKVGTVAKAEVMVVKAHRHPGCL